MTLITVADVQQAADRIAGRIVRTPLLSVSGFAGDVRPLLVKPENLQPIGAFKLRGALNAIGALDEQSRAAGVVTHSSGNHGQAVALAAGAYGTSAVIVMPDVSPAVKVEATRALGAEVVLVPPTERQSRTKELIAQFGYTFVPPYDDPYIIAGQGTVGLEIAADLDGWAGPDDPVTVLVPVGGGGLVSGVAVAVKAMRPNATVIGVEPELAGDLAESLRLGQLVSWSLDRTYRTEADGLRGAQVGDLPWDHIRKYVDDVYTVSEDAIGAAMRVLASKARLVAEPSGAVATAGYLSHGDALPPGPVVAVISGGNVEPARLAAILADTSDHSNRE